MIAVESSAAAIERTRPVIEFVRLQQQTPRPEHHRQLPEPPRELPPPLQARPLPVENVELKALAPEIAMAVPQLPLTFGNMMIGPVAQPAMERDAMPLSRPPPLYPYNAERKGVEGWVKLSFLVTEHGRVIDAVVIDAEPSGVFERAALTAVDKWKFKPRIVEGKPVAARMEQVVHFRLAKG